MSSPSSSSSSSHSTPSRTPSSSSLSSAEEPETSPASPQDDKCRLPSPFYPLTLTTDDALEKFASPTELPSEWPSMPSLHDRPLVGDEKDKGTPDEWVVRDERIVRLTGKWPLNCEAPLTDLFDKGFITPTSLFYVRNHGVVPRVEAEEAMKWTLEISGMVDNPVTLTVADLLNPNIFKPVTLPVTLVCAGNRRKEQNTVAKSLGFSWGPAGLSTALFTGVYLADVLDYVRPKNEGVIGQEGFKRVEHVIFEGAEDLPKGKYGTSQRLRWAKDKKKGMMLAWAMNGAALEPDHGYPLRLVVPGQIGGRSVKWLKKIELSDKESQHYMHFWDNKVLPQTLTAERARNEEKWWYDPRYIISDLNCISAMARPAHDEKIKVIASPEQPQTYTLEGYAYSGGGHRVTRLEISLDAGVSWQMADLVYPEDAYRNRVFSGDVWGTIDLTERDECFCWAFWKFEVDVASLTESSSITIRAGDEALNTQGASMYWNPTGMMNNWWYRVAIHKSIDGTGSNVLTFEHPTQPGLLPGGWMERMKEEGMDILNPVFTAPTTSAAAAPLEPKKKVAVKMTSDSVKRKITMDELKAHNKEEEPWFVVHGEVYDGTAFLAKHPGGSESITLVAGEDATDDFMAIHSIDAKQQLIDYHIGTLVQDDKPKAGDNAAESTPDPLFLRPNVWKKAQLTRIEKVSHDSRLYRFALEREDQPLGLPTGKHVYCRLRRKKGEDAGELVQRAYTPVSDENAIGFLDLLIKVYFPNEQYPKGGKMGLGFEELEVGECIEFKGPLGSFHWQGKGVANWKNSIRRPKTIAMVCAGSGITPIIQVLRAIVMDPEDKETNVWVVNSNRHEEDILCRAELDQLLALAGPRVRQHLCLSAPPDGWLHGKGRISHATLEQHLPPVCDDGLVLFCGPDPILEGVLRPGLEKLGWDVAKSLVVF